MPTQIKQIDDESRGITIFRVEGEMFLEDAELLSRIAHDVQSFSGNSITIDLADLDFLDSDSASVLLRLGSKEDFDIIGTEIFLQTVVNEAERR